MEGGSGALRAAQHVRVAHKLQRARWEKANRSSHSWPAHAIQAVIRTCSCPHPCIRSGCRGTQGVQLQVSPCKSVDPLARAQSHHHHAPLEVPFQVNAKLQAIKVGSCKVPAVQGGQQRQHFRPGARKGEHTGLTPVKMSFLYLLWNTGHINRAAKDGTGTT